MKRRLKGSREAARALRQMIDGARLDAEEIGSGSIVSSNGAVIAKLRSTIASGDHQPKLATLMSFANGAFAPTSQSVRVRHVGTGSVASGTIVFCQPVSGLGQCFARSSSLAPANFPIYRYMALVGPIAPELGTEDKAWTFPMIQTSPATGFTHEALWHSTDTVTSTDPRNGDRRWVYKMHPVRFQIEGYQSAWRSGVITQRFAAPLFPITGLSSVLPVSDSHVGLGITSARISNAGFNYNGFTSNGGIPEGAATHYRIWLDGVDKTGIVALTSPFAHGQFTNTGNPRRIGGLMPTQSAIDFTGAEGKTVWVDLWIQITVLNNLAFSTFPNGPSGAARAVMCNLDPVCSFNNSEFLNGNVNAKRNSGEQYKFTFSNAGPGGLSEITPTTSGWTMNALASSQNHRNNSVGFLDFKWFTESPHLDLTINSQNNVPGGAGAVMRYMPVDTGHYQLTLRSGNPMRPGVWNPQGTTVFQQVARQYLNTFYVKGSRELPSNFYTGFPDTITVEKA